MIANSNNTESNPIEDIKIKINETTVQANLTIDIANETKETLENYNASNQFIWDQVQSAFEGQMETKKKFIETERRIDTITDILRNDRLTIGEA
ncbi:hypothetical protein ABLA30_13575 [Xenorhabdus nematophila]|uniref:hypothetical protein n=1 Tax=Xenorhabdus nematophila TaxID=628 RepID=UPI0032B87832